MQQTSKPKPKRTKKQRKVLVVVSDGVVQYVNVTHKDVKVQIIDYDNYERDQHSRLDNITRAKEWKYSCEEWL